MSTERDVVVKDIENNKAELAAVKLDLKNVTDPASIEKLEKRRDRLEDTIGTLEKTRLALTPAQGKILYGCGWRHAVVN